MTLFNKMLKFYGVSVLGWIIDFSIYNLCIFLFDINISSINIISSLIGVTFIFIFSTSKIFENGNMLDIRTKYIIYIIYQIVLILSVSKVLLIFKGYLLSSNNYIFVTYANALAKISITPITASLNFIVMKSIIEKM